MGFNTTFNIVPRQKMVDKMSKGYLCVRMGFFLSAKFISIIVVMNSHGIHFGELRGGGEPLFSAPPPILLIDNRQ